MAGWQYKVIEIVAAKLVRDDDPLPVFTRRDGQVSTTRMTTVEGWRVRGSPHEYESLDDLLREYGRVGWELVNIVPASMGGPNEGQPVWALHAFFKAPA